MTMLKRGDRIRLIKDMLDEICDDMFAGTTGTVLHVYSNGTQVDVDWDNGRALMLLLDVDEFEVIGHDKNVTDNQKPVL